MKVVKFGGSSLANGEAFQNAINIITLLHRVNVLPMILRLLTY